MEYTIVLEKTENNWSASVIELDGCVAAADTKDETLNLIKDAIKFHIEGLCLNGDPIPKSATEVIKIAIG